jgi:alkanesulfonate monooxygenase SsuD/methylene tetrahydromethanopterin reductase-like flavin-dependent oxidoreductase (luciferase family)
MAQGRFVAGLGTGDSGNRAENDAYGVPFLPVAERVAELITLCRDLRAAGVRTWVGGRSRAVRRAAAHEADGWNCWGWCADVETFSAAAAEVRAMAPEAEISWAAQVLMGRTSEELDSKRTRFGERADAVYATVDELASRFQALSDAGAAWVICAPLDVGTDPSAIEMLAEAGQQAR